MSEREGRHACGRLGAVLISLLLLLSALETPATAGAWQEAEPAPTELAAPPVLEQAWSFVGRSQTTDEQVTAAGWLIAVSGLTAAELDPTEGAAGSPRSRFTFVTDIAIDRTSNRGAAVTTLGRGTLVIYLHEATMPDTADLASFRSEAIVAAYTVDFQSTAQRQSPELGVVAGSMSLVQTDALTFSLDDERFRFGHADAELELGYTGGLMRQESEAEVTAASIFGAAKVQRRAANPTGTGEMVIGGPELSECEVLLAWVETTSARLLAANELRATVLSNDDLTEAVLADASATIATLLAEQREDVGPEAAAGAARLALTVLNTDARGLELLTTAAAAGDQPGVDQALAILSDSDALVGRALGTLDEITPSCDASS